MELKTVAVVSDDGKVYHQEAQDVEPVLNHVRYLRETGQTGSSEMRHAAKIPWVVSENWRKKRGLSFHEFMANPAHAAAFLNSEDAAPYRIWPGKV
ncbi:hypothetical protein [Stutzerimonas kunmingensis]|uniref:hypothetical protein n=1 Tax=Stutzerimonas kunmingensis TaxID=1211807 RepID=UPI002FCBDF7D